MQAKLLKAHCQESITVFVDMDHWSHIDFQTLQSIAIALGDIYNLMIRPQSWKHHKLSLQKMDKSSWYWRGSVIPTG